MHRASVYLLRNKDIMHAPQSSYIIARQMGAQKWGICRTSSITEVFMQMKYTMGKEKKRHSENLGK